MMITLTGAISLAASGQKFEASKVPGAVKISFAQKFPNAIVKWEKENDKYEANFKQGTNIMSALFDANGTMTESEIAIKIIDLPANVLSYVKEHYNGKTIKEGAKITRADGTINFEAEVERNDLLFDVKGNFLKISKD